MQEAKPINQITNRAPDKKHRWTKSPPGQGVKGICVDCGAKSYPREENAPCIIEQMAVMDKCENEYDPFE